MPMPWLPCHCAGLPILLHGAYGCFSICFSKLQLTAMNRIRRPWTIHRQNTDAVQLNTLEDHSRTPTTSDEELGSPAKHEAQADVQPIDVSQGHLREIEVDLNDVLHDKEIKNIDGDASPYPEVVSSARLTISLTAWLTSPASRCARNR